MADAHGFVAARALGDPERNEAVHRLVAVAQAVRDDQPVRVLRADGFDQRGQVRPVQPLQHHLPTIGEAAALVAAGRAHDHRGRLASHPDLDRLLHRHLVVARLGWGAEVPVPGTPVAV